MQTGAAIPKHRACSSRRVRASGRCSHKASSTRAASCVLRRPGMKILGGTADPGKWPLPASPRRTMDSLAFIRDIAILPLERHHRRAKIESEQAGQGKFQHAPASRRSLRQHPKQAQNRASNDQRSSKQRLDRGVTAVASQRSTKARPMHRATALAVTTVKTSARGRGDGRDRKKPAASTSGRITKIVARE